MREDVLYHPFYDYGLYTNLYSICSNTGAPTILGRVYYLLRDLSGCKPGI
jgi:hypothetical protein